MCIKIYKSDFLKTTVYRQHLRHEANLTSHSKHPIVLKWMFRVLLVNDISSENCIKLHTAKPLSLFFTPPK